MQAMLSPVIETGFQERVSQAIERNIHYFLRSQAPAGYWVGELETNAAITAEYLFFRRLLNRVDPAIEQAVVRDLLATQVDGGWPLFYGGKPDLDVTLEASVALQMAGVSASHPAQQAAAACVRRSGGLERTRVFTRIWLALLGSLSWTAAPSMPPELVLFPASFPLNIYRFASWARSTIVPLLVIMDQPPQYSGPAPQLSQFLADRVLDEPFKPSDPDWLAKRIVGRRPPPPRFSTRSLFLVLDRLIKGSAPLLRRSPLRQRALRAAREWLLEHQEADGGWGGIQPAMVNSTLALFVLDGFSPAVSKGLQAMDDFALSSDGRMHIQSCVSPGWDTPWTMLALSEAGLPPGHPALQRAARWLLDQQSCLRSDWSVFASQAPAGGWPFEFANVHYPDTDDTALVLQALSCAGVTSQQVLAAGRSWLLGMQNPDGGWAAFDRQNTTRLVVNIPFCDFGEVLDPSSADVTAHVLEYLARCGEGPDNPHLQRGVTYLWGEQEADGAWYGRWGVNYVYGTCAALCALGALGFNQGDARLRAAAHWLEAHQNPDGGWGESCLSYTEPAWRGRGASTASQTAWAVMGLLAAGKGGDGAVLGGVHWLVEHQREDGAWDEPYFTGTGFPGDFYINYHEYRNYFPLLALAKVRKVLKEVRHG